MGRIKNSIRLALMVYICSLWQYSALAQNTVQADFNAAHQLNLHEKLYVHISKKTFLPGEVIWFKVYCTDGSNNKSLDLSKVAYVDVLDKDNVAVLQAKIQLTGGSGSGSLVVPATIANGNYRLRAYTNWMKNFDPAYYFNQQITFINPQKELSRSATEAVKYDVQFFPEGGHLVKGLNSKIAFKVTASDGSTINATGAIAGPANDTIARFKTTKFGIGSFDFKPANTTGYKAIVKIGSQVLTPALPEVSDAGYVLHAENNGSTTNVTLTTVGINGDVTLLAHTHTEASFAETATITNGKALFTIDNIKLKDGINYLTLFDANKKPVCERLIFKRPPQSLSINAAPDAATYGPRKKVNVSVTAAGADMSVSVFRRDSLQGQLPDDIAGYLWLSADIKGHIDSPGYYLENNIEESRQALENLLLSQGWSQFNWSRGNTSFTYLPEYTGPIITANLFNTATNQPAPGINGYLTIPGKYHQLYTSKSDANGRLIFNTKPAIGAKDILVKTNPLQDSTYRIDVASPFSEQYTREVLPSLLLNPGMKNAVADENITTQVNSTFDGGKLNVFENAAIDTSNFYGKPNYRYKLDDYTRFKTLAEDIHEYVRFISVTYEGGKPNLRMSYNKELLPGKALALVDGEPIFDAGAIYKIDPLKVKTLDVINTNYYYGPAFFSGMVSLTTYNGDRGNVVLDPKAITIDYEGLQQQRIFYSPVYDTPQQVSYPKPDFRTTLYWNPKLLTDKAGQGSIQFYTGDKPGMYIGIIQGLNANGAAATKTFTFEVK